MKTRRPELLRNRSRMHPTSERAARAQLAHGSRRWPGGPRGGFTLVELMVAIGVLLIALMATFSSQITSLNLMRTSRETNTAMADLQAAMEKILTIPSATLPTHPDYGHAQAIAEYDELNLTDEQIVVTYPGFVAPPAPDPLEILLTLSWNDFQGRPRRLQLSSVKAQ